MEDARYVENCGTTDHTVAGDTGMCEGVLLGYVRIPVLLTLFLKRKMEV